MREYKENVRDTEKQNLSNILKQRGLITHYGYLTFLCAFLSLFWVLSIPQLTKTVYADPITVNTENELAVALNNASTDSTHPTEIKLGNNFFDPSITFSLSSGRYAVLDLNGKTISSSDSSRLFTVSGNLTIKDSGTSGAITSSARETIGVMDGSLKLEGGSINCSWNDPNGTCVILFGYDTFEMNGGELNYTGGHADAGAVCLCAPESNFTQYGGAITGSIVGSGTYTHEGGTNDDYVSVTFNANGGSGDMDVQYVPKNTATALTANSFTWSNHSFAGWSTTSTGAKVYDDVESVTLSSNTDLYALWTDNSVPTTYNITVNTSGGGTASTASASAPSAAAGANITLTATAGANYHFVNWTATGVNISNATSPTGASFTMPSNAVTVTANFSQNSSTDHTITVTTDGHGTAQATPTSASNDAVITLSATPSNGYEFDRWTSTTNGIHFANYRSRNTTFDMVDENVTVKANFKAKSNPKKDDDDDDHHEESSSPEKPSWTPAQAAATIAAQKAQKQQAAATQLASIQTMLRTKTSDRAGTGRNVIDLDMTKVDILDPATVNLLLLNNRFAFNVKISVPGGLTTTIMIPANFNFRPFIKADGTMNIHEVLWWIISKRR